MNIIPIASSAAIVLGLAATLPQITTMVRTRSASGQSPLGWTLGLSVNVLMGYINLTGLHAELLGLGNLAGAALNAIALSCVMRFAVERYEEPAPAVVGIVEPATPSFEALPTEELYVIKSRIDAEHARREAGQPLVQAA